MIKKKSAHAMSSMPFVLLAIAMASPGAAIAQTSYPIEPGVFDRDADHPAKLTLKEGVRRLEDIEAIRSLRMQYFNFMSERQFNRVSELFTEDACTNSVGINSEICGRENLYKHYLTR